MKYLWSLSTNDYLEIVKMAKASGIKEGESMEKVFLEYMKKKNKKPLGATELTTEELIKEYTSHGKSVLSIKTSKTDKSTYKITKPKKQF